MSRLEVLADRAALPRLSGALAPWLTGQRWFAGKARVVTGVQVDDVALLARPGHSPAVLDVFVEVSYASAAAEHYQVPLVALAGPGEPRTFAEVDGVALGDALTDHEACRVLAGLTVATDSQRSLRGGLLQGYPLGPVPELATATPRLLGVEQSNTSVVLDERFILKVFRRLQDGVNPDVEVTRALTAAGFPHVPRHAGATTLVYGAQLRSLAVLATFAPAGREGWARACAEAAEVLTGRNQAGEPAERTDAFREQVARLGAALADLHAVLGEGFGKRAAGPEDGLAWAEDMRRHGRHVLDIAALRSPEASARLAPLREAVVSSFDHLAEQRDLGWLIRTHGDLHLGQVLFDPEDGWLFLDFEGEPARPLPERRRPMSPLRDVAGMLRSFDYAAAHAALEPPADLAAWRDGLRESFLSAYLGRARPAGLLPGSEDGTRALLQTFELDKAMYELGYELANRPGWVGIPTGGILRILGAGGPGVPPGTGGPGVPPGVLGPP